MDLGKVLGSTEMPVFLSRWVCTYHPWSFYRISSFPLFLQGPHMCIAKAFAYQQMRHVLARLVLNYDMQLPKGFDTRAYRDGILNMRTTILKHPLDVTVKRRAAATAT